MMKNSIRWPFGERAEGVTKIAQLMERTSRICGARDPPLLHISAATLLLEVSLSIPQLISQRMGACQSENPQANPQGINDEPQIDVQAADYIVLANWRHDEYDGSNQPNAIEFGRVNKEYTENKVHMLNTRGGQSPAPQMQRISVFSGYSQIDQSKVVLKDSDIQRRPINFTRRNIW